MAKKKVTTRKTPISVPEHTCAECVHHYGEHEIGASGKPFLCHCDMSDYWKKFSRFLKDKACKDFEMIRV